VWCTLFDATAAGVGGQSPFMHKTTTTEVGVPADAWIAIGECEMSGAGAEGSCGEASWSLRFSSDEPELRHLPRPWQYSAPFPRTKLTTPLPAARFEGTLRVGERVLGLDGWRGMVGHNWGAEHAERWIWLHGIDFEHSPGTWLDLALARVQLGGRQTPWIGAGALSLDGQRMRLGGLLARGVHVAESVERCSISTPGPGGVRVQAHVDVPAGASAGWRYADPGGGEHDVVNCSIASLTITAQVQGERARLLSTAHGCAYELGMRERDHGVPVAPFPDG
jgi:hypothetical protein